MVTVAKVIKKFFLIFISPQKIFLFLYFHRFCIALEEMDGDDTPISLVLGCGAPQLVRERAAYVTLRPSTVVVPEREALR